MYLFLGETDDVLGRSLRQALEARGARVHALPDPFSESTRFSWRLGSGRASSSVMFQDGKYLAGNEISGVFLGRRKGPGISSAGSDGYSYIQAEIQAATLGWIWGLQCPVINRLPAWLWYYPRPSLRFWSRLLQTNHLQGIDSGRSESVAASRNQDSLGSPGSEDSSIVGDRACIVGRSVIWNRCRPGNLDRCETALIEFTHQAGLSLLEIALARMSDGTKVKEVDPFPDLSRFCAPSADAITEALANLFTGSDPHISKR